MRLHEIQQPPHRRSLKLAERENAVRSIQSVVLDKQMPFRSYLIAVNIEGRSWYA